MWPQDFTKQNEGCILVAQPDAKGMWEIGYGHDIPPSPGLTWTQGRADSQFEIDYTNAQSDASRLVGTAWSTCLPARQAALTDMAYELGLRGLSGFGHMLAAIEIGAWDAAADECLASAYATEVPRRAGRVSYMLRTGLWPSD